MGDRMGLFKTLVKKKLQPALQLMVPAALISQMCPQRFQNGCQCHTFLLTLVQNLSSLLCDALGEIALQMNPPSRFLKMALHGFSLASMIAMQF